MRSSCDLKVSGLSNNLWEVSGTVLLSLSCCTSMTLFEFSGGSLFSMCFPFFFVCARTRAVDGQICEYAREKVRVRVWWFMSASARSHVWAMVSARLFGYFVVCAFVCVSLCVCVYVCTRFVEGRPIRRTFFASTSRSRNPTSFLLYQI